MPTRNPFLLVFFIMMAMFFVLTSLEAQSDKDAKRRISQSYIITNATIIPFPGEILSHFDLFFDKGIIKAIGKDLEIPPEAVEIKGDSLFVYAGLIDLANKTGVIAPELPEKPNDFDPSDPSPEIAGIHPHYKVTDHYHMGNTQDEEWRKLGFTLAQKLPQGSGMLPGSTALILYGSAGDHNVLKSQHSLYAKFSTVGGVYPITNLGIMAKWRDLIQNTLIYQEHQLVFTNFPGTVRRAPDEIFESLKPLINKEISLLFETSNELEMRRALMLWEEFEFDLILTGIKEGESLIPILNERNLDAVLTINLPKHPYPENQKEKEAADLDPEYRTKAAYLKAVSLASSYEKANIPFGFTTKQLPRADLYNNIRTMISHGLTPEGALAALTINAARILEIDHLIGTLESGKLANMLVSTDTLFKEDAKIAYTIVDGHVFDFRETEKKEEKAAFPNIWHYETATPDGAMKGLWHLQKKEGEWAGTISYDDPDGQGEKTATLTQITISEKEMQFQFTVQVRDQNLEVTVRGEISGDTFSGDMNIQEFGSFPVKAEKKEIPEKK